MQVQKLTLRQDLRRADRRILDFLKKPKILGFLLVSLWSRFSLFMHFCWSSFGRVCLFLCISAGLNLVAFFSFYVFLLVLIGSRLSLFMHF